MDRKSHGGFSLGDASSGQSVLDILLGCKPRHCLDSWYSLCRPEIYLAGTFLTWLKFGYLTKAMAIFTSNQVFIPMRCRAFSTPIKVSNYVEGAQHLGELDLNFLLVTWHWKEQLGDIGFYLPVCTYSAHTLLFYFWIDIYTDWSVINLKVVMFFIHFWHCPSTFY